MGNVLKLRKKLGKLFFSLFFLLTFISLGAANAQAYSADYLVPLGNAVGINLQSEGVMIVGVPEILSDGQSVSPALDAGLSAGDIITKLGSQQISTNDDLKSAIAKLDGTQIAVTVTRAGNTVQLKLTPHKTQDGHCELGLWMRDGIAGIGTLTFYDPETGIFGALGHSVNDLESGGIIPLRTGSVTRSVVTEVVQGKAGLPGQLHGTFNSSSILGTLSINSASGIFGNMTASDITAENKALPVAKDSEIKTGPAVIMSNVSGTDVKEYDIEITRIYTGAEAIGRSVMISITDEELLEQTGGIVQGMSGSPIIQNGKLIGAVTHVLINDPTRGYGISIANMLDMIPDATNQKAA